MTYLLDTQGEAIPNDEYGCQLFNASLCDWNDGEGPILTMNVPMYFDVLGEIYDSAGVVSAPLQDVLEEYLLEFEETDGGKGVVDFCAWLHDYADRLKAANAISIAT